MTRFEAHIAIGELLAEYFARTDHVSPMLIDDLFAPDGRMRLGNLIRDGRPEIAAYFAERVEDEARTQRKTRHVMSNLVLVSLTEKTASVRFQCLVYAGIGDFPLPSEAPATIADFEADSSHDGVRWYIQELRGHVSFSGAHAAKFTQQEQ